MLLATGINCSAQWFNPENKFQHESPLTLLAISRDQNTLIAGDEKGYLHFHNLDNGYLDKSLKVHERPVAGMRFNSTGKLLI